MNNPYLRSVLIVSLFISILSTIALLVGLWNDSYSISNFGSIDTSSSTWVFIEKPNMYRDISKIFNYIEIISTIPFYFFYLIIDPYLVASVLFTIGPIIVFIFWSIVLYFFTYLYAEFIKKNLITENKNYNLLIMICILVTVLLSVAQHMIEFYVLGL